MPRTNLRPPEVYGDPNVYSFIRNNIGSFLNISGNVYWVDLTNGGAGGDGSWDDPTNLMQTAHGFCTSGNGDAIFVRGFSGADDAEENLVWTKRDIRVVAEVPVGNARMLTVNPASGIPLDLQASAWGCAFYNVRFAGTGAVGAQITADGGRFEDCDFTSTTTHGAILTGHASDPNNSGAGALFRRCHFRECGGNGLRQGGSAPRDFYATNVMLQNCYFYRNTDSDIEDAGTRAGATYFYQWLIEFCNFMERNKTNYLEMQGGADAQDSVIRYCTFNDSGLNNVKIKIPSVGFGWQANYDSAGLVAQATIT